MNDHKRLMKVLVRGAGFAGLACCWHLLEAGAEVYLYDPKGIGGGASGVSPGLLHRYPGRKPRRVDDSDTRELLAIAGPEAYTPFPILRLIPHAPQLDPYDDCTYLPGKGLLIHSALTVHAKPYLEGLWRACQARGAQWGSPHCDREILAIGSASDRVEPVKGQILRLRWPDIPPLPYHLIGRKYLVMGDGWCEVGATFEHDFDSPDPDLETAKRLILPHILPLVPELKDTVILECRAGVRAAPPGHFPPIIEQLDSRRWLYTGLGSKGLLYHSTYAKTLVKTLCSRASL